MVFLPLFEYQLNFFLLPSNFQSTLHGTQLLMPKLLIGKMTRNGLTALRMLSSCLEIRTVCMLKSCLEILCSVLLLA